jgi:hypothetical protein
MVAHACVAACARSLTHLQVLAHVLVGAFAGTALAATSVTAAADGWLSPIRSTSPAR